MIPQIWLDHNNVQVDIHMNDFLAVVAIILYIAAAVIVVESKGEAQPAIGKFLYGYLSHFVSPTLLAIGGLLVYALPALGRKRRGRYYPGVNNHPVIRVLLRAFFGTFAVGLSTVCTDYTSGLICFFITIHILVFCLIAGFEDNIGAYECFTAVSFASIHSMMDKEHLGFSLYPTLYVSAAIMMGLKEYAFYYYFKNSEEYPKEKSG